MDIKIVGDNGQVVEQTQETVGQTRPNLTIPEGEFLLQQVAQTFDLKPSEISQYKSKLNTLIEYAKLKTDEHTPDGLKWAIRQLGVKVGTPPLGEKLINYLTRYAYIYLEGKKIEAEKEKFLRGEEDR